MPRSTGNTNSGTRELTLKCKFKCYISPWITHWALALVKGIREPHEGKHLNLHFIVKLVLDPRLDSRVDPQTMSARDFCSYPRNPVNIRVLWGNEGEIFVSEKKSLISSTIPVCLSESWRHSCALLFLCRSFITRAFQRKRPSWNFGFVFFFFFSVQPQFAIL